MLTHCGGRKSKMCHKGLDTMYVVPLASCICKAPASTYIYPVLCNATMTNLRLIIWHLIILAFTLGDIHNMCQRYENGKEGFDNEQENTFK